MEKHWGRDTLWLKHGNWGHRPARKLELMHKIPVKPTWDATERPRTSSNRGRTVCFRCDFLVHKDIVNSVMRCHPFSSGLIEICLGTIPSTSQLYKFVFQKLGEVEGFYHPFQTLIDQIPIFEQGDENANIRKNAHKDWRGDDWDLVCIEKLKEPDVLQAFEAMVECHDWNS